MDGDHCTHCEYLCCDIYTHTQLENDVQLEDLLYRLLRRHVDHVMRHMFKQTLASGHFGKAALVPHCVQGVSNQVKI